MGHVTADRLEEAWKKLNKAEHLADNNQTHAAVLECENALQRLFKSADGMGFGVWFSGKENDIREDIAQLKIETAPEKERVEAVIQACRDLTKETKDKIIPELHSRIDYEVTVRFR